MKTLWPRFALTFVPAFALAFAFAFAFAFAIGPARAADPTPPTTLQGKVLEVRHVDNYSYLRLKTATGEAWAAVDKAAVKKGANVSLENVMVLHDFESRGLKRTFATIHFGNLAGAPAGAAPVAKPMKAEDLAAIKVDKAPGDKGRTVAEIVTGAAGLKDQAVVLRAKVVKYNPGIMGRNWIHLRDGSGSAADNSHDILATSTQATAVGEIVTLAGTVRTDRDFGSGYAYKVLIEDASLQP